MLSSIFPKEYEQYFLDKSIGATSNANNSFQWSIINGLQENGEIVDVITAPNIGAYPMRFTHFRIPNFFFRLENGGKGISIGWKNLVLYKHFSIYRQIKKEIKNIDLSKYKYVLVYDLNPVFFQLLEDIKLKNSSIKIISVVPDIIGMTRGKSNSLLKIFDNLSKNVVQEGINHINGFIYLTKYMVEKMPLNASQKPSLIIEGICNPDVLVSSINSNNISNKYVLYTGSLDIRHGIINLLKGFKQLNNSELELWICGDGDGKDLVQKECEVNPKIKYLGQKPRHEIISLQSRAFLLINPRGSSGEFTKYSFPSKIIEYFLSGRPTFMYKLPGIPEEYFEYCYTSDQEDFETLAICLEQISKIDPDKMSIKGISAREFIINNKSSKIQSKKIIDLVNNL